MSANIDASSLPFIIIAILTAVGGYFARIFQKYQDHRDDVHLKILPSLYYSIRSFTESVAIYKKLKNFNEFKSKVDDIVKLLGEKISSGEILLTNINYRRILLFYWSLQTLQSIMTQISGTTAEAENWRSEFLEAVSKGNKDYEGLVKVDPVKLLEEAQSIQNEIDNKIHGYKSISFILLLIIAAAVLAGLANYLTAQIESEAKSDDNKTSSSETFSTREANTETIIGATTPQE